MKGRHGRENKPAPLVFPDVPPPSNRDDLDIAETDDVDGVPNEGEVAPEAPRDPLD